MKIKMETFKLNDENDRENFGINKQSLKVKKGRLYYQDRLSSSRRRAPIKPKRDLVPSSSVSQTSSPSVITVVVMSPMPMSGLTGLPQEPKRIRIELPSPPRRKSIKIKHRRFGIVSSPCRVPLMNKSISTVNNSTYDCSTNAGFCMSSTHPVEYTKRTLLETWDPPGHVDWNRETIGIPVGPQYLDNSASSSSFTSHNNNNRKIPAKSENWENEDPVGGDEARQAESAEEEGRSDSTDTNSNTDTTETDGEDLDSTLGLVQKDETDTAEEDGFGGHEDDTDSASENEFRTNDYYNSPKPVVSINEVPNEDGSSSALFFGQAPPRLTVEMSFEETDQFGNKSIRGMYRRRCDELALKIGTPLDPYHPANRKNVKAIPPRHVYEVESDLVIAECFESPNTSGESSTGWKNRPSSGLISISSSSEEITYARPIKSKMTRHFNVRAAQARFLRRITSKSYGNPHTMKPSGFKFLTAFEGNQESLIHHWLNHPSANIKRFSYFDEDQQ